MRGRDLWRGLYPYIKKFFSGGAVPRISTFQPSLAMGAELTSRDRSSRLKDGRTVREAFYSAVIFYDILLILR